MTTLTGAQRKYLRGLAHNRKPAVLIGQNGLAPGVLQFIDEALDQHELIKVKFNDYKEKSQKASMNARIAEATKSALVGMVGHVAIFYRRQADPEKRVVQLPVP